MFRNSKRYPALLKYIVEQTLDGRGDGIKERILGIEVFGRAPDYDTNSDHVVRTAAGEVRKRLAQYYMEAGHEDEIRIEVPAGAYVAQFRLASEILSARQLSVVASPVVENMPDEIAVARRFRVTPFVISIALNCALLVALSLWLFPGLGGTTTLQKFWDPVFATEGPVLICVGLRDGQTANGEAGSAATTAAADPLLHRVAMADMLALARVASYVGQRHEQYRVLDSSSTSLADLRNDPTVLIGAGNNAWTRRLTDRLRYDYVLDSANRPIAVIDRRHPERRDWSRSSDPVRESEKDYAIVSRVLDPQVEQVVVIAGGLGAHGTEVAGEFLTDPDQIRKLEAFVPAGWKRKNLQVVLSTVVVKGSSGPPKIEAAYFW